MIKGKKGESGIGTLILFIAMILVAAIAAGVLIQTSMNLQSRALSTGSRAQSQVSTSIAVNAVWAEDGTDQEVENIFLSIKLVPGSDIIKLEDTLVEVLLNNDSQQYGALNESADVPTETDKFNYFYEITGAGNQSGYIVPGDLVTFSLQAPRSVGEDENVRIQVTPKTGSIAQIQTSTPEIMTSKTVYLFP